MCKVGDKVRYRAAFLRSISCFTSPLATAQGIVLEIKTYSPDVSIARIDWGNPDVPEKVNVCNLETIRGPYRKRF